MWFSEKSLAISGLYEKLEWTINNSAQYFLIQCMMNMGSIINYAAKFIASSDQIWIHLVI